jgi:hypothetical protein
VRRPAPAASIRAVPNRELQTVARVDHVIAAMDPWDAARRYLNFTERPSDAGAFFPEGTLRRLQAVKGAYDPADVFRANHPVTAAA